MGTPCAAKISCPDGQLGGLGVHEGAVEVEDEGLHALLDPSQAKACGRLGQAKACAPLGYTPLR